MEPESLVILVAGLSLTLVIATLVLAFVMMARSSRQAGELDHLREQLEQTEQILDDVADHDPTLDTSAVDSADHSPFRSPMLDVVPTAEPSQTDSGLLLEATDPETSSDLIEDEEEEEETGFIEEGEDEDDEKAESQSQSSPDAAAAKIEAAADSDDASEDPNWIGPSLNLLAVGAIDFEVDPENVSPADIDPPLIEITKSLVSPAHDVSADELFAAAESASSEDETQPQASAAKSGASDSKPVQSKKTVVPLGDDEEDPPIADWMHELLEPSAIKPKESGLLNLVPDPVQIKKRISRRAIVIEQEPVVIDDSSADKSLIGAQLFVGLMAAVFLAGGGFVLIWKEAYNPTTWMALGAVGLVALFLGRIKRLFEILPYLTSALGMIVLVAWRLFDPNLSEDLFGTVTLGYSLIYGLGGYLCIYRLFFRGRLEIPYAPTVWAMLSAGSVFGYLVIGQWALPSALSPSYIPLPTLSWATMSGLLATLFIAGSLPLFRIRKERPQMNGALGALVIGICAFVAALLPMMLPLHWYIVAWSVSIPGVAVLGRQLKMPVTRLAAAMLALAIISLLLTNPYIVLTFPLGERPVMNWILYGYASAIIGFALAAWLYHQEAARLGPVPVTQDKADKGEDGEPVPTALPYWTKVLHVLIALLEVGAVALAMALVTLEIRHYFHRLDLLRPLVTFAEISTYCIAWLAACLILLAANSRHQRLRFEVLACVCGTVGGVIFICGPLLLMNPMIELQAIGQTPILNNLLYVYGGPAFVTALIALCLYLQNRSFLGGFASVLAIGLWLIFVGLSIRHAFHPQAMNLGQSSLVEWGAYINVWMFTCLIVLILGSFFSKEGLSISAEISVVLALILGGVVLGALRSPLQIHESVGQTAIFNWLLYLYGVPAIAAVLFAILGRMFERRLSPLIVGFAGVIAVFMLITLEVRQLFHGEFLDGISQGDMPSNTEWYSYSASWVIYCLVLVAIAYIVHKRTHALVRASETPSSNFEPNVSQAAELEDGE